MKFLGQNLNGTFAEYIVVPEANVFEIPEVLDFELAAALPLAYLKG